MSESSEPAAVVVVAAAILDAEGRLLAARRSAPSAHAGGWEFPGGKVEPGESEHAALIREIDEELGVRVEVGERIGGDFPLQAGYVMRVHLATIVDGEPAPLEDHDELRWLEPGQWWDVPWLDADRAVVTAVEAATEAAP